MLCGRCREDLGYIDARWSCPKCGAPYGHLICTECYGEEWNFDVNYSLAEFGAVTARMIVLHKDQGERRLAQVIGSLLAEGTHKEQCDLVTWIPATEAAYRRRGFDHAHDIAQAFAQDLGHPIEQTLTRIKARDQRVLGRDERADNMRGTFLIREGARIEGRHITIVDDAFTTGATINEAARVLQGAGAAAVTSVTFARVW